MLKKLIKVSQLVIFCVITSQPVSAATSNSLNQKAFLKKVEKFVSGEVNPDNSPNIEVTALPLDSRIRIKTCNEALTFDIAQRSHFTRQFPVKVSCNDKVAPWKQFAQVRVKEYIEALVTTKNIGKGELITSDHIKVSRIIKRNMNTGNAISTDTIIGGRAIRNLHRGFQIAAHDVCLVCKGDDVSIVAQSSNMMIKTSGTAIESGAYGESIKVKNNASDRIVKGTIGELRQVYVNL